MEIKKVDYQKNKEETLQGLEAYFTSKLSDLDESPSTDSKEENSMMRPSSTYSYILENHGITIGRIFGEIDYFNSTIKINGLIINQDARGTGAGTLLMEAVEQRGKKEGCHLCFVNTTLSSAPQFYEKQGYKCLEKIKDYPVKNDTYFYYYKRLF